MDLLIWLPSQLGPIFQGKFGCIVEQAIIFTSVYGLILIPI